MRLNAPWKQLKYKQTSNKKKMKETNGSNLSHE